MPLPPFQPQMPPGTFQPTMQPQGVPFRPPQWMPQQPMRPGFSGAPPQAQTLPPSAMPVRPPVPLREAQPIPQSIARPPTAKELAAALRKDEPAPEIEMGAPYEYNPMDYNSQGGGM